MHPGLNLGYWLTLCTAPKSPWPRCCRVITAHVLRQRRHPAAAIACGCCSSLLVPYVALPAFLMFGSRKARARGRVRRPIRWRSIPKARVGRADRGRARPRPDDAHSHRCTLNACRRPRGSRGAVAERSDGALHTIDLCTFIIRALTRSRAR